MPKITKPLTAIEVKRLNEPKAHPVGTVPGLMLNIQASGTKAWIFRTTVNGRRAEIGLGGYPAVLLAGAIEAARAKLVDIKQGVDPVADRRAKREVSPWTFKKCALAYIEAFKPSWKSAKHGQQWENTLETYVYPHFGHKHVKDVDTEDVLNAIRADWSTKNETMVRVRNRIELVLSWAAAKEYRPKGFNPAQWRGHLDQVLPKPSKVNKREHHPALPIDDMHAFMQGLRSTIGTAARCLEFVILTACRSGEARMATWAEFDCRTAVWSIPAERMKADRPHRVPLSPQTIKLLGGLPKMQNTELVFPGRDLIKPLSDMTLTAYMRRLNLEAVPHGFRSTFSDWTAERTSYPAEVREMALAHAIGNDTDAAYRRGDLYEKRRNLMNDWAAFIDLPPACDDNAILFQSA
jgi:integrase